MATKAPDWAPPARVTDLPKVPSPWEVMAVHGEGLFELQALMETGARVALGRVNATGDVDIAELPPTGYSISSVVQIGEEYIVGRWVEEYRLNAELEVISVRELDMFAPTWRGKGPVAYLLEGNHVQFLDRASGVELPGMGIAEGHQARVLAATATEITVLIYRRNPCHSMSIIPTAVATYSTGTWTTAPLQEAPAELF